MDGSTFDARSGTGMKPLPAASGDAGRVVVELDPNIIEKTGSEGIPTRASGNGHRGAAVRCTL
ncbi:hypothetical protein NC652_006767 [Populus alba x Populus x berolinensis]|nr:hypothetical protein NC652_006767 [Populus alba x Populus x berolinensis]